MPFRKNPQSLKDQNENFNSKYMKNFSDAHLNV